MHATTRAILEYNAGRDPPRLSRKYEAMRADPFTFFRGTAPLFFETLKMPPNLQDAPKVIACGDLHLENFGSYKGDNRLVYFDISDFDEACVAPLTHDVVRFLSSVLVASAYLKIGNKRAQSLIVEFADTYAATIATAKPRWLERATATGPVRALLRSVKNRHRRDLIARRTEIRNGKTKLIIDNEKTLKISKKDRKAAKVILAAYASTQAHPPHFAPLDIAVRIAGVGSLGLERYVALVRGDGTVDGRYLVDIKFANPSALAATLSIEQPAWKSDADRAVSLQTVSQAIAPDLLDAVFVDKQSYLIRELQPTADRVNLPALNGNKQLLGDVIRSMAEVIAWAHLRGCSRFSSDGMDVLTAYVQGSAWKEILNYAAWDAAILAVQQWQEYAVDFDASGNAFADTM